TASTISGGVYQSPVLLENIGAGPGVLVAGVGPVTAWYPSWCRRGHPRRAYRGHGPSEERNDPHRLGSVLHTGGKASSHVSGWFIFCTVDIIGRSFVESGSFAVGA